MVTMTTSMMMMSSLIPQVKRMQKGQDVHLNVWPLHYLYLSIVGGACCHDYYHDKQLTLHPGKVPAAHFSSVSLLTSSTILPCDYIIINDIIIIII